MYLYNKIELAKSKFDYCLLGNNFSLKVCRVYVCVCVLLMNKIFNYTCIDFVCVRMMWAMHFIICLRRIDFVANLLSLVKILMILYTGIWKIHVTMRSCCVYVEWLIDFNWFVYVWNKNVYFMQKCAYLSRIYETTHTIGLEHSSLEINAFEYIFVY